MHSTAVVKAVRRDAEKEWEDLRAIRLRLLSSQKASSIDRHMFLRTLHQGLLSSRKALYHLPLTAGLGRRLRHQ